MPQRGKFLIEERKRWNDLRLLRKVKRPIVKGRDWLYLIVRGARYSKIDFRSVQRNFSWSTKFEN